MFDVETHKKQSRCLKLRHCYYLGGKESIVFGKCYMQDVSTMPFNHRMVVTSQGMSCDRHSTISDHCTETGDLQVQMRNSSDLVRGVKGYFLVRVLTATSMTFRVLERLGAEVRDREAWLEYFRTVIKFQVGMEPLAT